MAYRLVRSLSFLLFVSILMMPGFAYGQARTSGAVSGSVVDPSGAGVPGATLTMSTASIGLSQTVNTNATGDYVFPDLPPGTYTLTVNAKGFEVAVYNQVTVNPGRTTDLKVLMKVGASTQTVEVSAVDEVLETSTNTLSTTVDADQIQDLPLAGRDALPFAELVPGAQSGGDERFTTYNAMPNGAVNISVDGMNDNFQRYRTSTTGFYTAAPLRLGAIDEMTVSTDDLTADAGAEGAVTIRVTTKHGTNAFHGNGFWQAQNSFFNANSYYSDALLDEGNLAGKKSSYHINDFGGGVGGPIWKNKVFFYFNYEYENQPSNYLASQSILTPAAQAGSFTYTRADGGGPQTVNILSIAAQAGVQNCNPTGGSSGSGAQCQVNPVIASELSTINGYTANGTLAPSATLSTLQNTLDWQQGTDYKQVYPFLRLDYQITPKILWHASYNMYWRTIANTPPYPGDPNAGNGFQSTYSTFSTGVDWTINSHLVNQVNFGILNTQEEFNPGNSFDIFKGQTFVLSAPGFTNGGSALTPVVPSTPYSIIPEPRNNPVWDVTDNVTWTHGNHTFTFGGDLRISNSHDTSDFPPPAQNLFVSSLDPALNSGMFTNPAYFPGGLCGTTGPGCSSVLNSQDLNNAENLYATLLGDVGSISGTNWLDSATKQYQIGGLALFLEKQTVGGIYVQDSWKVTPHLALNMGFRWQFSGAVHNTNNLFTSPTYGDLLGPSSGLFQPGVLTGIQNPQIEVRPAPYKADLVEPAPNIGFAWNPQFSDGFLGKLAGGNNLVIRGGFAISHYDEGWTTFEQVASNNPGLLQSAFLGVGQFPAGSIALGSNPTLNTFPTTATFPIPESDFTFGGVNFGTVNPNLKSPYIENWNFGVQRKLPGNFVFEANYVGNHSVHMWTVYDLNEISVIGNGFLPDFQNAQKNLAMNGGASFADNGTNPTPIIDQAFGPSSGGTNANYTNPNFISFLNQGQAGAFANQIASNQTFFCNLVGSANGTFSPCAGSSFPTSSAYPINIFQANPFASGQALQYLSDPGSENYNGLQVNVKHPVGHGLNWMVNYAYSHSFTNRYIGDYYTADEALMNFTTLRDPKLNRVPSPYDLRNIFRTYLTYDLPFGRGKMFNVDNRYLNGIVGGWTVGSIFTWQTGRDFKLQGGYNTYNYYPGGSGQPDTSDSGVVLNGITPSQLQSQVGIYQDLVPDPNNPGQFVYNVNQPVAILPVSLQASGKVGPETTPGQLGSFIFLHGPMFVNTDISIVKNIPIWERVKFNFYATFLNAFNHPNWNFTDGSSGGTNNPGQYLNVSQTPFAYGTLAQSGNRTMQFRLQLQF